MDFRLSDVYGCVAPPIGFTLCPNGSRMFSFDPEFTVMMSTVKPIRLILAVLLFLTAGCDRGSHPRQTGRLAPDFTVTDGNRSVHLADYRGKIVVLNFWATWCTMRQPNCHR